jgi:hypothetical protein
MSKRLSRRGWWLLLGSLGLLVTFVVANSGPRVGHVTGKVFYRDMPLPSGTVTFVARDGSTAYAVIAQDQTYTITDAPVGPVRIAVQSHPRVPPGLAHRPGEAPDWDHPNLSAVPLPARYSKPEASGLTYTVEKGRQTHHIILHSEPRRRVPD